MPRKKQVKETPEVEKKTTKKRIPKVTTAAEVNKDVSEGKSLPEEDLCESWGEIYARIKDAAYYRYLKRGRIHGHDVSDWLEAEKTVLEKVGASVPGPK